MASPLMPCSGGQKDPLRILARFALAQGMPLFDEDVYGIREENKKKFAKRSKAQRSAARRWRAPNLFPGLQFSYEVREAILRLQGNEHLMEEQRESRLSVGFWASVALKVLQRKHLADDAFRRGQSKGAHRATRKAKL
jgi:hypothetical protein